MKKILLYTFLICNLSSCSIGAGTLGGFDERIFPTSEAMLKSAIDSLFNQNPGYRLPAKWVEIDNWEERGYGFLDSRIFYFSQAPEEVYYVTFIPTNNSRTSSLAIRAVHNGKGAWKLEESFNKSEKERIQNRFDEEIITKLENFSGVNVEKE